MRRQCLRARQAELLAVRDEEGDVAPAALRASEREQRREPARVVQRAGREIPHAAEHQQRAAREPRPRSGHGHAGRAPARVQRGESAEHEHERPPARGEGARRDTTKCRQGL